jgi:hypothetical protein
LIFIHTHYIIAGLYAGSYPLVVINDWKLAKELFAKEVFSGRLR